MTTDLYFGYGSNLELESWDTFCREHGYPDGLLEPVAPALLPDRELAFTRRSQRNRCGALDIRPRVGAVVEGMTFRVTADVGWEALDRKEGAPRAYRRVDTNALRDDGTELSVRTYEVRPELRAPFVAPNDEYLGRVRRGLDRWGLDAHALEVAADDAHSPGVPGSIFVYDDLMRGEPHARVLRELHPRAWLLAESTGRLHDTASGVLLDPGSAGPTRGELVTFDDVAPSLQRLDERHRPRDAARRMMAVSLGGRIRRAWTYVGGGVGSVLRSGCWRCERGRMSIYDAIAAAHGDEVALLHAIARSGPFPATDADRFVFDHRPLGAALATGRITERELAQASGQWVAWPEPE